MMVVVLFRPTFGRIVRNRSTEEFSGLPYVYSLMNCLICMWYGLPWVAGVVLLATVNSAGAAFQMAYVALFLLYADRDRKVRSYRPLNALFKEWEVEKKTSVKTKKIKEN